MARDWSFLAGWKRAARDVAYLKRLNPKTARIHALRYAAIYASCKSPYWQGYVKGILSSSSTPRPPVAAWVLRALQRERETQDLFRQFEQLVAA